MALSSQQRAGSCGADLCGAFSAGWEDAAKAEHLQSPACARCVGGLLLQAARC